MKFFSCSLVCFPTHSLLSSKNNESSVSLEQQQVLKTDLPLKDEAPLLCEPEHFKPLFQDRHLKSHLKIQK